MKPTKEGESRDLSLLSHPFNADSKIKFQGGKMKPTKDGESRDRTMVTYNLWEKSFLPYFMKSVNGWDDKERREYYAGTWGFTAFAISFLFWY